MAYKRRMDGLPWANILVVPFTNYPQEAAISRLPPILPILSLPSTLPRNHLVGPNHDTHAEESRTGNLFFSSPLVTANCFVCASLSEIIIPPGPRPRLDETPVVHAVFRFSLLDKDVEKHLAHLGIPWINVDHKDVRMGESGESGQH